MFDRISSRYDLVNRVMTFGMDVGWRRRAVGELRLPGEALVADLACGTGDLCNELLASGYRTLGFDFSHGMLRNARTKAPVVEADVLRLPLADGRPGRRHVRVRVAQRDRPDRAVRRDRARAAAGRARRVPRDERARGPVLRAGHALYFRRIVPLIGGALSDGGAYRYLPRSTAYLPEPDRLLEMLDEAGFEQVERTPLAGGVAQMLLGTRR
jgi:demethylmenaquinone methyltransferase/2-methoxy-6-polyprenyl-1,4-benzoquinol methylase